MKIVELDGKKYYISTYVEEFEDGTRIISVGTRVSSISRREKQIDISYSIKSPRDDYSEELEFKIITGRINKPNTRTWTFIPKIIYSKRVLEEMMDTYARNIVRHLSKKYKIVQS